MDYTVLHMWPRPGVYRRVYSYTLSILTGTVCVTVHAKKDSDANITSPIICTGNAKSHDPNMCQPPCGCEQVYRDVCSNSGVYTMDCGCGLFTAYCDMTGNWTVFQRRFNGVVEFYRNWTEYVNGFGKPNGEYWMGLDNVYCMTNTYPGTKLRVELGDWEGNTYYAEYSQFVVGDSSTNYRMNVSGYSGNAGDRLTYHNGQMFSTYDQDHDSLRKNCADEFRGGWWFKHCHNVNLNGEYLTGGVIDEIGVTWVHAKPRGGWYSFKVAEMKLKFN